MRFNTGNTSNSPSRFSLGNPKNGHQRVIVDRDDIKHLEFFMNGSWRHDIKCRCLCYSVKLAAKFFQDFMLMKEATMLTNHLLQMLILRIPVQGVTKMN